MRKKSNYKKTLGTERNVHKDVSPPGAGDGGTPLYNKPYRVSRAVVESENSFIYRMVTKFEEYFTWTVKRLSCLKTW